MDDLLFDPAAVPINDLAIDAAVARQNVAWFVDRYGAQADAYRLLACYAAMPLVLTPELLNYLHNRFLANAGLPWVAEVDLLLSELVQPVGEELYAMPPATRAYLLAELRQRVGAAELANVARVLIHYTRRLARTNPALDDEELRAQQWAAMVYLDELRPTAVREVAEAFRAVADQLNAQPAFAPFDMQRAEFARLAHITQMLAPQIQEHRELVEYAHLVSRLLAGETVDGAPMRVTVADTTLTVPDALLRRPPPEAMPTTDDIHIRVTLAPDGLYTVKISAPEGETATHQQALALPELVRLAAPLHAGAADASAYQSLQTLGRQLYDFLFAAGGHNQLAGAAPDTAAMRLLLQLDAPELSSLPWELLHDGGQFLIQSGAANLVRVPPAGWQASSPPPTSALHIVAIHATPQDGGETDRVSERRNLEMAAAPLIGAGLVELTRLENASLSTLQRTLQRTTANVLYYVGEVAQKAADGSLWLTLVDERRRPQRVDARDLATLLAKHAAFRLALIHPGESGPSATAASVLAATLVRAGVPAALALQGWLDETATVRFTSYLLRALTEGRSLVAAVATCRRDLTASAGDGFAWALPVLCTAAPDAILVAPSEDIVIPSIAPPPPITFDWIEIPAGPFLMGSDKQKDPQAYDDELPQHTVTLPAYRIARTPVTNAQYRVFVQATGHRAPQHWKEGRIPEGKEDHPVVYVTWQDAVAFCAWASEVTGMTIRLPSEAEWEKAARGVDGRIYPWGNEKPTKAHCNFNMKVGDTTPVGSYPKGASPYGMLDAAGNVWEWTNSLFTGYPYNAMDGREDPHSEGVRTVRGGSFYNVIDWYVRCACRLYIINPLNYVGLRVASPGSEDSDL